MAFSFNASQSYVPPEEVRRRAFLVYAQAVLDETRPEAANRARAQAQEDFLRVRGAFFRAFLPGLLEAPSRGRGLALRLHEASHRPPRGLPGGAAFLGQADEAL